MMDLQTFEDNLDRRGGSLALWPTLARRDAEALLAGSAPARALHAAMIEVERVLASPCVDETGVSAAGRFAAIATRQPQQRASMLRRAPMVRRAGWGAAIAAALVLGILVGDINIGSHDDTPDQVLASALGPHAGTVDVD